MIVPDGYERVDPSRLRDGAETIVVLRGTAEVCDGVAIVHGPEQSVALRTYALADAQVFQRPVQWLTGDPGDEVEAS